jgi:hypothetical protein
MMAKAAWWREGVVIGKERRKRSTITLREHDRRATLADVRSVATGCVAWCAWGGIAMVAVACGGTVDSADTASQGPEDPIATGGRSGVIEDGGIVPVPGTGGSTSEPDPGGLPDAHFDDPGCRPTTKTEGSRECDTTSQSGCGPGERCVPYVSYGANCESEEVGTRCDFAGSATQGQDCTFELCAAGYVCVTGGAGFSCAHLCTASGASDDCPPGLLCSPLDVDGFAVCS